MTKLRRMLGDINDSTIIKLMALIESQSAITLANWSLSFVENNLLPLYQKYYSDDLQLANVIIATHEYLQGNKTLKEHQQVLKEAKELIVKVSDTVVALAALRAILTACATKNTPTNALGFTFYGAAAIAYDRVGLNEDRETYDALAKVIFEEILQSLQMISLEHETNAIKVNWNC